jgi:hypothetical protein
MLVLSTGIVVFSGCSRSQRNGVTEISGQSSGSAASATKSGSLELSYRKPAEVSAIVHATAVGLPPNKAVDLKWGTVTGGWVIEDYYHFRGKKYSDKSIDLGEFQVDLTGRLDVQFAIPEDYGGVHEVVALINGKAVAQNGIDVTQTFELAPISGPIGTPIELKAKGLGWRTMEST